MEFNFSYSRGHPFAIPPPQSDPKAFSSSWEFFFHQLCQKLPQPGFVGPEEVREDFVPGQAIHLGLGVGRRLRTDLNRRTSGCLFVVVVVVAAVVVVLPCSRDFRRSGIPPGISCGSRRRPHRPWQWDNLEPPPVRHGREHGQTPGGRKRAGFFFPP